MPWTTHRHAYRLALTLGGLALAAVFAEVGPRAFAVGAALAVVPVPLYVWLALRLDRLEPEPPRMLATTFLWGATVAVGVALVANTVATGLAVGLLGEVGETATAVLWAPVVEEAAKGLALLIVFLQARDEFDNVTDGVVYAAMVGLGFAMIENVQYYGRAHLAGPETATATVLLRGVAAPFAHPLFTAMIGIGLGLARERPGPRRLVLLPLAGFAAAVLLHAAWNLAASFDEVFHLAYAAVMVPVFGATLLAVRRSLAREAAVIRAELAPLLHDGTLTAADVAVLCSVRARSAAALRAARATGLAGWRREVAFQRAATELAFHRRRAALDGTDAAPAEATYRRRLDELAPRR